MAKKEKPWYKKIRGVWGINPRTRVKNSNKIYNRQKEKEKFRKGLIG